MDQARVAKLGKASACKADIRGFEPRPVLQPIEQRAYKHSNRDVNCWQEGAEMGLESRDRTRVDLPQPESRPSAQKGQNRIYKAITL